jgi:hypothetical protein
MSLGLTSVLFGSLMLSEFLLHLLPLPFLYGSPIVLTKGEKIKV